MKYQYYNVRVKLHRSKGDHQTTKLHVKPVTEAASPRLQFNQVFFKIYKNYLLP